MRDLNKQKQKTPTLVKNNKKGDVPGISPSPFPPPNDNQIYRHRNERY